MHEDFIVWNWTVLKLGGVGSSKSTEHQEIRFLKSSMFNEKKYLFCYFKRHCFQLKISFMTKIKVNRINAYSHLISISFKNWVHRFAFASCKIPELGIRLAWFSIATDDERLVIQSQRSVEGSSIVQTSIPTPLVVLKLGNQVSSAWTTNDICCISSRCRWIKTDRA